jgi:hypothetical protein
MSEFEYLHTFIGAAESNKTYPAELVEEQLNKLGQRGWELVNMTPDWAWVYEDALYSSPDSVPDHIQGWYCTFKRSLS